MARQARAISKSGNYYIELRGRELYVTDADKTRFSEIAAEKFAGGSVYGIEITKNEIRMVVKEPSSGISIAMKSLTTVYARYFNNANGREGKLFEGRFRSEPIETKKELDEHVSDLGNKKPAPTKSSVKQSGLRKASAKNHTKSEEKQDESVPKNVPQKSLPSWLL